jgi:hypothetical protein
MVAGLEPEEEGNSPVLSSPRVGQLPESGSVDEPVDEDSGEPVDEEIVIDAPPLGAGVVSDVTSPSPTAAPPSTHCATRFATPPVVFSRPRLVAATGIRPTATVMPRTLGEFLSAAKMGSSALLQTPAARRRLLALDFQPRRSSRIAKQPGGNTEMRAVRNLLRKLGLIKGEEEPSVAAMEAYHRMYELPLSEDMVEAIAELYGWSLSTLRGCSPPVVGQSGGRLVEA